MQRRIPEEDECWTYVMSALQQAWVPRGQGLPECGWKGWHFSEAEFAELERVTRGAFSVGWAVASYLPGPHLRLPGSHAVQYFVFHSFTHAGKLSTWRPETLCRRTHPCPALIRWLGAT